MAMAGATSHSPGRHGQQPRSRPPAAARPIAARPRLSEPGNDPAGGQRIDHRADAERRQQRADRREAEIEALVQLRADVGERAEHHHALEEHRDEHDANPRPPQDLDGGCQGVAPARASGGDAQVRSTAQVDDQQHAGRDMHRAQQQHGAAPADPGRRAGRRPPGRIRRPGSAPTGSAPGSAGAARKG